MLLPAKAEVARQLRRYRAWERVMLAAPADRTVRATFEDSGYTLCVLMGERCAREAADAAERYLRAGAVTPVEEPPLRAPTLLDPRLQEPRPRKSPPQEPLKDTRPRESAAELPAAAVPGGPPAAERRSAAKRQRPARTA
ncbi:DUF5133 domain-containing protein [Streptomyces sp. NPDC085946]|uniref:DUF5133 domain-containing protein n=1 Tax=Streptomyces sp. NPDC085946 TaxID=3365744 RepID=UPI0037D07326